MIYLWYPAFQTDSQELDMSQIMVDWLDANHPLDEPRTRIKLRNPDFYDSLEKPSRVTMKRSMNGVLRSYVIRDRVGNDPHIVTLSFQALHSERILALEHFIMCAKGDYIGYKDADNLTHAAKIQTQNLPLSAVARACEQGLDEHHTATLQLMIVRTYNVIEINWS